MFTVFQLRWFVMRPYLIFGAPLAVGLAAAAIFITGLVPMAGTADANEPAGAGRDPGTQCSCQDKSERAPRPKFADLRELDLKPALDVPALDVNDEYAALSSVQHALANVADGSTYVWHRQHGRLSGLVKPTASFKNADGAICRHIVILLTTGDKTNKTEGVACRSKVGRWSLDG